MGHDGALRQKVADDLTTRPCIAGGGDRAREAISPVSRATMTRPIAAVEVHEEAPMEEAPVLAERRAGYRVITLNRPRQLNAFNEAMHHALKRALAEAEEDADCRALLLTGAGRAFCAGQDLRERMTADGKTTVLGDALDTHYNPLVRKLRALPFPVVAAVNGVAAGAGANIALACDIVLAARSASFVQAFVKIGLIPDCGGTWLLPRLVGPARARGLALTAEPLPADKAEAWGLIWKTLDDLELMAQAHQLCVHFTAAPTVALALIKRALDEAWGNDLRHPARPRARVAARGEPLARLRRGHARVPAKAPARVHRTPGSLAQAKRRKRRQDFGRDDSRAAVQGGGIWISPASCSLLSGLSRNLSRTACAITASRSDRRSLRIASLVWNLSRVMAASSTGTFVSSA